MKQWKCQKKKKKKIYKLIRKIQRILNEKTQMVINSSERTDKRIANMCIKRNKMNEMKTKRWIPIKSIFS